MHVVSRGLVFVTFALFAACDATPVAKGPGDMAMNTGPNCIEVPEACPGGCREDSHCAATPETSRCDRVTHQCVPCLPDSDTCPIGNVCQQINGIWSCVPRCTTNNDCQKLGGGSLCCSGGCVNPATDTAHCGACGNSCPPPANGSQACVEGHCIVGMCNAGFDDCDHAATNGCETIVSSDATNCGKCGNACKPFTNGLSTCTNGQCSAICAPGYADCDNDVNDGCEVDTTFDVKHCGGCGKVCAAAANADPFCDLGKCSFRAKLGFADCDGNPANGAEVNTGSDANHCGHCGNICPLRPNAVASACIKGQCTNTCAQGFGDCDLNANNGCEADVNISLAACGGCGKPCSNRNAIATCDKGICTLQCNPGYMDCNMDGKDGCESKLLEDAMNCGACGNACPQNNPFCAKGICGQTPPYPQPCDGDVDEASKSYYTICAMNQTGAWIASDRVNPKAPVPNACVYTPQKICQKYGFARVNRSGGTCGTVCGYCGAGTCMAPQNPFIFGTAYTTFGNAADLNMGQTYTCTIHWECQP